MVQNDTVSRRDFLKVAAALGGAVAASSGVLSYLGKWFGLDSAYAVGDNKTIYAPGFVGKSKGGTLENKLTTEYKRANEVDFNGDTIVVQAYKVETNGTLGAAISDVAVPQDGVYAIELDNYGSGNMVILPGIINASGDFEPKKELISQQMFANYLSKGDLVMNTIKDSFGVARQVIPYNTSHDFPIAPTSVIFVDTTNTHDALEYAKGISKSLYRLGRNSKKIQSVGLAGMQCGDSDTYMMVKGRRNRVVEENNDSYEEVESDRYHIWEHNKKRVDPRNHIAFQLFCDTALGTSFYAGLMPGYGGNNPAIASFASDKLDKRFFTPYEGADFRAGKPFVTAHVIDCRCYVAPQTKPKREYQPPEDQHTPFDKDQHTSF